MTYYVRVNGTTWPLPDGGLAWRLRYLGDSVSAEDAMRAAEIICAYEALVMKPQRLRNLYAGAIKRAATKEGR